MSRTFALLLVASSAFAAEERVKVAVLDLQAKGAPAETAASVTNLVASELDRIGVFKVVSGEDIRAMLTFEKTRQSLGCESDISCLAEIGGALGVDYIVAGSLGKLGDTFTLFLNLMDIKKAVVEGRVQENVEGEAKLIPSVKRGVGQLVGKVLKDREGYLIITVSEPGATVKVDEQVRGVTPIRGRMTLAWGPHLVTVEKQGFVSFSEDVHIPAKQPMEKTVTLIPSMDFINAYESTHSKLRLGAWITSALAVVGLGGAAYFAVRQVQLADDLDPLRQQLEEGKEEVRSKAESIARDGESARTLHFISLGVGALGAGGAAFFWIAGDDPDKYERFREASAPSDTRIGVVPVEGGAIATARVSF